MTPISPLENVLKKGLYGDHEGKGEDKLTKVKEIKNLLIVQIVQYKSSSCVRLIINVFQGSVFSIGVV